VLEKTAFNQLDRDRLNLGLVAARSTFRPDSTPRSDAAPSEPSNINSLDRMTTPCPR
jgi:hypothetical protein